MKSLYCRRLLQALILLFKCFSGTGPTYIVNLFKYRHTPYGLRGEGSNLELPNFNLLKFKRKAFIYLLTKLLNSSPFQGSTLRPYWSHLRLSSLPLRLKILQKSQLCDQFSPKLMKKHNLKNFLSFLLRRF